MNVAERPTTLVLQQQQLLEGLRPAQMFPKGTPELPKPEGMARIVTSRGVFHFNPEMIKASDIVKLSNAGRENEILELGPFNKEDVAQMVARGEKPLAVTERRDGVEVKSAVGTESTADHQLAALDRTKLPGSEVVIEPVEDVISDRGFADGGAAFGTLSPGEEGERAPNFLDKLFSHVLGSAATLPRRAIENSQYSLDSGNYDPSVPVEAALLPMGTGAIAGVPMRAGEAVLGAGPIRAYHGSPHDFDKFDLKKIGTGEGAQAYGHGLYFAENKAVADGYKTSVTRNPEQLADIAWAHGLTGDGAEMLAHQFTTGFGGKRFDDWIGGLRSAVDDPLLSPRVKAAAQQMLDKSVEASDAYAKMKTPGRMYEVNINADPKQFLDWDKPLKGHDPQTQDAIKRAMSIDYYGKPDPSKADRLWSEFGGANTGTAVRQGFIASDDKLVASRLREQGIPGIKYLDQGSRGVPTVNGRVQSTGSGKFNIVDDFGVQAGPFDTLLDAQQYLGVPKQTSNYVVFDDKLIDILRKYGIAALSPVGIAAMQGDEAKAQEFMNGGIVHQNSFADGGAAELPDAPWATPATSELPDAPWGAGAPEPKPEPTSAWSAAAHGAGQGVSFNFSDEMLGVRAAGPDVIPEFIGPIPARTIAGAARLAANAVTGKDPEAVAAYEKARDEERKAIEAARRDHPYITMASEIAGGLATPIGVGAAAPTLAARMGRAALTGSGVGAMYGAGSGETMSERAANAGTGALVGGATGAVAPPLIEGVIQGVSRAVRPIANTIRGVVNPEAEAGRRVVNALERDFHNQGATFTPEEAAVARAANSPTAIIDAGGETTRALGRSAANTSPEARTALTGLVQDRFGTQNQRTSDFVQRLTGATGDNPATQEALQVAARQANRPAYAQAYRDGPVVWSGEIEQLAQAPAVQDAIRQATRSGANRAAADGFPPVRNPFEFDDAGHMTLRTNPDGSQAMPSLQFWDHVKRNLDDQHTSLQRSGENSAARDINDLRRQLLEQLDVSVPSYASARAGAARAFGAQDALEAGANFITSRMENAEARRAVARMTAPERQLFQQGYASALINKVREAGDRRTVLNQIAKSPAERERLEIALGPQRARELEVFLRVEGIMDRARAAVTGNSTTARQLAELGLAGGAYGIAGYGDLTDPRAVATGVLVLGLTRGRHRIDERVAQRVGEMLASNNPNVLQRGLRQVARAGRIFDGLRSMDGFSKIGGQQAPHPKLSQGPVPASAEDEKEKPPRKGQEKPTENQPD